MALIAFPMQSNYLNDDEHGNPIFDRAVDSMFYRTFWKRYFTNGIFYDPTTNFSVTAIQGEMKVRVQLGECHINGLTASPDDEVSEIITLDASETATDRTDRIVIRADFELGRNVTIQVRKNWKSTDTLLRNSNYWELAIADILIKKGSVSTQQVNITDLRLDEDLCGVVTEPIKRTNTDVFFTQLQEEMELLEIQKANQQSGWLVQMEQQASENTQVINKVEEWYDSVKVDITKLQTFDFDNLAVLGGCTKDTSFESDGRIAETIKMTGSGKSVATRVTAFDSAGIIEQVLVFEDDGESILMSTEKRTDFNLDGSISEVVSWA